MNCLYDRFKPCTKKCNEWGKTTTEKYICFSNPEQIVIIPEPEEE